MMRFIGRACLPYKPWLPVSRCTRTAPGDRFRASHTSRFLMFPTSTMRPFSPRDEITSHDYSSTVVSLALRSAAFSFVLAAFFIYGYAKFKRPENCSRFAAVFHRFVTFFNDDVFLVSFWRCLSESWCLCSNRRRVAENASWLFYLFFATTVSDWVDDCLETSHVGDCLFVF